MRSICGRRIGTALIAVTAVACGPSELALVWTPMADVNARLSSDVEVLAGVDPAFPLRAWAAKVDLGSARIRIRQSDDESDNRETVASFATDEAACVAVNGGYFSMSETPATHGGLLVEQGVLRWRATGSVTRDDIAYPTARAALGFGPDGEAGIAWVTTSGDSVLAWEAPLPNTPGAAAELPQRPPTRKWDVVDALAAGPLLVRNGAAVITSDQEVFFGSSIPDVHPRTAAGVTAEGDLLLLVVDGRQPASRGVDLEDLAAILLDLGAVEGLNLDGGGSSTMVAAGEVLNRPAGGTDLREVMSAITVHCSP